MKTLPKQTSISGTERSMFSPEDSHANPSPSLVEERERTITATSGLRCFERYGRYTPLGSLVKTLLESRRWWSPSKSLRWDAQTIFSKRITYIEKKADSHSTKSVQTSKPKDIPSNRLLFQLAVSERPTEGIESGLLPTPNAMDIPHKDMEINERGRRNPKKGKTDHSLGLEDMAVAKLLPTPTAMDKGGGRINRSPSPNAADRPTLALAARKGLLPTPTAMEIKHSNRVKGLTDFQDFHYLLTPSASDGKRANMKMQSLKKHNKANANLAEQIAHKVGGGTSHLNPLFVEEMMGFPLMWTALPFLSPSGDKNP